MVNEVLFVKEKRIVFITGFLVALIIVCAFVGVRLFSYVDNLVTDQFYYVSGNNDNIVLVLIGDETIAKLGAWPIDRENYSKFLDKINAKIIGIDISFFDQTTKDDLIKNSMKDKNVVLASELSNDLKTETAPIFGINYGYVNVPVEKDGVSRKIIETKYTNFAKKVCELYTNDLCKETGTYLNFSYIQNNFKTYKFEDIVLSNKEYDFGKKIVLLGSNVKNLHDYVNTPLQKEMQGVVYQANYIENYLQKNFLNNYFYLVFLFCVFLVIITFLVGYFIGSKWSILLIVCLFLLCVVLSLVLFNYLIIFSLFYPLISLLVSGIVFYLTEYQFRGIEKRGITNLFSKYVSKNVVNHMLKDPKKYTNYNSERKRVTVLFGDIRGFTKMSSQMDSEDVMHTLNAYLNEMTEIIFKHGGTVDKYVGDEIMAVFNSPTEVKDHERKAFECAKEMLAHVAKVNKQTRKKLNYGIGINSGYVVAGSFGSKHRLEYGVLGDTVNLASRFCSVAQGNEIVIGKGTYDGLRIVDRIGLEEREYDLKGKGYITAHVWKK